MPGLDLDICTVCGRSWGDHDADLQYGLPDEVLHRLDEVVDQGAWMSGPNPRESDLLRLPPFGTYVRALLSVRVEGGGILTYGTWVKVAPEAFENLIAVWPGPEYASIHTVGVLASKLPFQDATYAEVTVEVIDPNRKPVITSSADYWTQELIDAELPHSFVD